MLEDSDSEADDLMQSQMQLILTQFCSKKRKQIVPDSLPCSRKSRAGVSLLRRDAWGSIFGLDTLMNPHIQNPQHPAGIRFRKRFRVPYAVFLKIVDMFKSREGWNPASSNAARASNTHPLEIKILCSLFILGRGVDLDTVSMLSRISIGTLTSFFHHFCESMEKLKP